MKNFFKNFIDKFCLDKKFNNMCLCFIEIPLFVLCLIFKKYNLLIWGILGLAIINAIIKKIYKTILIKKSSNIFEQFIIENNYEKEDTK